MKHGKMAGKNPDLLENILDSQYSIVLLTDGCELLEANHSFFEFFSHLSNLEDFHQQHQCLFELFHPFEGNTSYLQHHQLQDSGWLNLLLDQPRADWKTCLKRAGHEYYFSLRARCFKDKPSLAVVTLQNITQMEQTNNQYTRMFRDSQTGMFLLNSEDGCIMDLNQSALRMVDGQKDQHINQPLDAILGLYEESFADFLELSRSAKKKIFEAYFLSEEGMKSYYELHITPITLGTRTHLHCILHDVTERKEAEQSLWNLTAQMGSEFEEEMNESLRFQERYLELFENVREGIALVSLDEDRQLGAIQELNPYTCEIFNVEKEELLEQPLQNLSPQLFDEGFRNELLHNILEKGHFEKQLFLSGTDETRHCVIDSIFHLVQLHDCQIIYITFQDKTETYEAQKKQSEQESLLIQQSKMAAMGEMIGAIAHQWKQPLNAISLLIQELPIMYEYEEITADSTEKLSNDVMQQIHFMSSTIDDFRNFFKPSNEKQSFIACETIGTVYDMFQKQFDKDNIEVIIRPHEHFKVHGYPNEFKQVILNILNNAKDVIVEKKIPWGIIDCHIETHGNRGVIRIADNGGGIPEALLPDKIFEPYVTTKGEKGTGIGLQISKTIIENKMDGKLWVHNVKDGAEFVIELPLMDQSNKN